MYKVPPDRGNKFTVQSNLEDDIHNAIIQNKYSVKHLVQNHMYNSHLQDGDEIYKVYPGQSNMYPVQPVIKFHGSDKDTIFIPSPKLSFNK